MPTTQKLILLTVVFIFRISLQFIIIVCEQWDVVVYERVWENKTIVGSLLPSSFQFSPNRFDLLPSLTHLSIIFFQQYISGHFDTKVGAKTEPKSYKAISEMIHTKPSRILFVTDVTKGEFWLSYFPFSRLFFAISYDLGKNVKDLFIVEVHLAIKLGHKYSSFNDLK